jgi:hypothetical protein
MAINPGHLKRQKEAKREEKQREKEARREERRLEKEKAGQNPNTPAGVDPDIAHIVPGPQPDNQGT